MIDRHGKDFYLYARVKYGRAEKEHRARRGRTAAPLLFISYRTGIMDNDRRARVIISR